MQGVFVSYRREDSAGHTGRLFDRLSEHFGKNRVFMDISDIEPGVDFVDSIEKALIDCEVLLVVIGRDWGSCVNDAGQRRLDDPNDFIRLETATSLRRNIRVIPVLVQGARMPAAQDLPEELQGLTRRQAIEVSDTRWDYDTRQLIETLEKVLTEETAAPPAQSPSPTQPPQPAKNNVGWWKLAVMAALAVAGIVLAVQIFQQGEKLPGKSPSSVATPVQASRVPNVIGQPVGNAKWQLEKSGFTLGVVQARRTDKEKAGTVLDQDPAAGASARLSAPVALVIAEAPEVQAVKLPDVVGQDAKTVLALLEKRGLVPEIERKMVFSSTENGIVLDQKPSAGTPVAPHSTLQLLVGTIPQVHASGGLELKQTWTVDLDTGRLGPPRGQDLFFHAVTSTERYLEPRNGARMAFFGGKPRSRPPGICAQTTLSRERIPIDMILDRSSLCVLTDEGRYAYVQFAVDTGGVRGLLKMKFTTWSTF